MRGKIAPVPAVEYGPVRLPARLNTPRVRERLLMAAAEAGKPGALVQRGRQLRAGNCVGVIDVGEVVVEILPKTGDGTSADQDRDFLRRLLAYTGRDRRNFAMRSASVRESDRDAMEVILAWAVREVVAHLDYGLPRRYVEVTERTPALRGRIGMAALARTWPGRTLEFTVTHAPLTEDNPTGQIVRWLLLRIAGLTRRTDVRTMALAAADELSHIADVEPDAALFGRVDLRPLEEHWQPVIDLAASLARQRAPDPVAAGGTRAVAILFTLHDLFEGVLRQVFRKYGAELGLWPARHPRHLLHGVEGPLIGLVPDFSLGGSARIIGDAKWKDIWKGNRAVLRPDPRNSDAHQLVTYLSAMGVGSGFMFAPLPDWAEGDDLRDFSYRIEGGSSRMHVIGVRLATLIADDGSLARALCAKVLDLARRDAGMAPYSAAIGTAA